MIAEILLILASAFFLVASLGLFRLPEGLPRLHAGTKASSLAVLLLVIATILRFPEPGPVILALASGLLVFATAPLASHAIAIHLTKGKAGQKNDNT
ncbi:MAG: monovalent cation/H(+) antiporter subunit G [Verrucomicrobiota bacterium]